MSLAIHEDLLRLLAERGEMPAQEFVARVVRKRNDYSDFYGVAAMLHSGLISTDSMSETAGEKQRGTLGPDSQSTAVLLCQLALPRGQSIKLNGCARDSLHSLPLKVFITAQGLFKIEEIDERARVQKEKRFDYAFAVFIAILAAAAGGFATSYFTPPQVNPAPLAAQVTGP